MCAETTVPCCIHSAMYCVLAKVVRRDKATLRRAHRSRHKSNQISSFLMARYFLTSCLLTTDTRNRRANSETKPALGRHSFAIHCYKVDPTHIFRATLIGERAALFSALALVVSSCRETQVKSRQTCLGATLLPGPSCLPRLRLAADLT
jgi:hypothetical protein